jgi:hypothetical protein
LAEITNLKEEILSKTYVLSLYCIVTFTASLVKWNLHFLHSVLKFQRWKFRYLD